MLAKRYNYFDRSFIFSGDGKTIPASYRHELSEFVMGKRHLTQAGQELCRIVDALPVEQHANQMIEEESKVLDLGYQEIVQGSNPPKPLR